MQLMRIATLALPLVAASTYHGDARASARQRTLRVCADPNNLPFSNRAGAGFENRLVEMVADEMRARVEYTWWAQRRGFIRNTLRAGLCDVVAGIPMSFELVLPTRPYYRSTYVFVRKTDAPFSVASLEDAVLKKLRIGVHFIGDDGADTPPAHALARRGIIRNVREFSIYGDYRQPNPPAQILDSLIAGRIDLAIVWGPLAGYFATSHPGLSLAPVRPQVDNPFLPMVFDISMGVRREDVALRDSLEAILARRAPFVDSLLAAYGVPRVDRPAIP